MEDEKTHRAGDKQLARARPEPFFAGVLLQGIACAYTCQQEHQGHEPRIQDVHYHILILMPFRIRTESAYASEDALVVIEIDDVVEQYKKYGYPTQIVQPMFSHFEKPSIA